MLPKAAIQTHTSFLAMQIHITPRHLRLTASIHQAVASHIFTLEDFGLEIVGAHVVLLQDDAKKPADRFLIKVHLAVPGPDIFAEQRGEDMYIALEQVTAKLASQLRKRKTETKEKPRAKAQKAAQKAKASGETRRKK